MIIYFNILQDKLMDDYLKTNKFPGRCIRYRRTYRSLLNSLFWVVAVGIPFLYLAFKLLTIGNVWITTLTVTVIVLCEYYALLTIS